MAVETARGGSREAGLRGSGLVRFIVIWLLALAVAALVIGFFYRTRFVSPADDAMDYGQIAYNISKGRGFVTNNIVPLGLYFWKDVRKAYNLEHGPGYPLFLALLLYRGTQDSTLALGSIIWFLLSLLLVYFVGVRLFSTRVGFLAAALLLFAEPALATLGISGMSSAMAGFLLLAACYLLYRPTTEQLDPQTGQVETVWTERVPRRSFWAGVVAGLAYLTQLSLWLLILPASIYLWITNPEQRGRHVALFLLGFILISLPYWIRNARLTGNPFFSLRMYEMVMATRSYPGYSFYRQYKEGQKPPRIVTLFVENAQQIVGKWVRNMRSGLISLLTFPHPILMGLAFAGLFVGARRYSLSRWRNMIWWTAALVLITCSFGVPGANAIALYCFAIPFAVLAAGTLEELTQALAENADRAWRWSASGIVIVLLVPLALSFVFREPKPARDELFAFSTLSERLNRILSEVKQRGANLPMPVVGMSDVPWRAAWYTHHIWVWLPETPVVQVPAQLRQGQRTITVNTRLPSFEAARDIIEKTEPLFLIITPQVSGPPDGERLQGWVVHYNQAVQLLSQTFFVTNQNQLQQLVRAWRAQRRLPYDPVNLGFYPLPEVSATGVVTRLETPRWVLLAYAPQTQ